MPDDLTVTDPQGNTLEVWESIFGTDEFSIPLGKRKAQLWKKMPASFFNWLSKMLISRLNRHDEVFRQRVLWADIEKFLYVPEGDTERPPQYGTVRGHSGRLLRKHTEKKEPVYFRARARYSTGAVKLKLTAESTQTGRAVLAVGVAQALSGPWTYYYGTSPWEFDPNQDIQEYEIATTNLTVGAVYYYRLVREVNDTADTLNASVLIEQVQVR